MLTVWAGINNWRLFDQNDRTNYGWYSNWLFGSRRCGRCICVSCVSRMCIRRTAGPCKLVDLWLYCHSVVCTHCTLARVCNEYLNVWHRVPDDCWLWWSLANGFCADVFADGLCLCVAAIMWRWPAKAVCLHDMKLYEQRFIALHRYAHSLIRTC